MPTRVLIIDDDAAFRRIVEIRLRSFLPDLQVVSFDTVRSARSHLATQQEVPYDLVLLDQRLPDGGGIDLLNEGLLEGLAVLAVSSERTPEMPGANIKAGAAFFLNKESISEPLFQPLVLGIIDRNRLQAEVLQLKLESDRLQTVKTLVSTLRHEINNPLGAVLGAAYLLRTSASASKEQLEAAQLVESSGKRIKHVLDQLCETVSLEPVQKSAEKVFHIPGDKPWGD